MQLKLLPLGLNGSEMFYAKCVEDCGWLLDTVEKDRTHDQFANLETTMQHNPTYKSSPEQA